MRDKHQSRVATTTAITTRRFSSVGLLLALFVLWSFSYLVGPPQPSSQRHHQLWLLQQAASQQQQKTKKISLPTSKKRGNLTDDDDGDGICNIGRPVFVLHVGLEKTGTTFLQNTLCSNGMTEFLEQDDYEFLGVHCRHSLLYSVYKGIFTEDESSNNSASSNSSGQKKKKNQQQPQARSNHSMFYNFKHDEENDDSNLPTTSLPRLDPSFENHVLQLAKQGKNVILINEFLARHSSRQVEALAAFLRPHFCVRICIAYRRLYEWLPSSYNQYNKPTRYTKFSNDKITSSSSPSSIRLERFDLDHLGRSRNVFLDVMETQQHPTQMTRDKYARYYKDIQIMNLHALRQQQDQSSNPTALAGTATITSIADVDPLLEYFVCAAIPQASSTCQAVRQGLVHGSASRNPSVSTDCDRIGVAAFEAGWLTSSNTNKATNALRRRRYVAQQIQQHDTELRRQEQQPKATSTSSIMTMSENEPNTLADFPRECMSKDKLDLFFNLSWTVERNLFGQASTAGTVTGENNDEQFHRDFEAFALKRLCSVDTAAVLRDASWQKFLQSLNGNDGDKAR